MIQEELDKKIELHKKWLQREDDGEKLVLTDADLNGTDLSNTDLRYTDINNTDLRNSDLSNTDLRHADLRYSNLSNTDLRYTDLSNADLRYTDLKGANLDYSVWPLWCGSLSVKVDSSIRKQLAYHLLSIIGEDMDEFLANPIEYANGFHRVEECGKITKCF